MKTTRIDPAHQHLVGVEGSWPQGSIGLRSSDKREKQVENKVRWCISKGWVVWLCAQACETCGEGRCQWVWWLEEEGFAQDPES